MSDALRGGSVIFDYDRTLVPEESLLEVVKLSLGHHPAAHAKIQTLQDRADRVLAGNARFDDLPMLLGGLFCVRRDAVRQYAETALDAIQPFQPVFETLRREGAKLFIASAAFGDWLVPIGARYDFPASAIAANRFHWLGERAAGPGNWALALSGDKTALVRRWRRSGVLKGPAVMIGDSASDFAIVAEGLAQGFVSAGYYADKRFPDGDFVRRACSIQDVEPMASDLLGSLLRSPPGRAAL